MEEVESPLKWPSSSSPEPNCSICLGACNNKSFSNSCTHQFCFRCLLEWSKVKAECPLCKKAFNSIIHNVKSKDEYDQHIILPRVPEEDDNSWYIPSFPSPRFSTRHQFHFRTTLTVDPGGEIAIQQMLLRHPFTNYLPHSRNNGLRFSSRRRIDTSSSSFRRFIYAQNLWVYSAPDITGRYREITPRFFRENPAARQRLVPWLNRELNALLYENTQQIMRLVDVIMEYLLTYHIRSITFRAMVSDYLFSKTEHFIHEFYNFMKSPYDMVGYDRHVTYYERPISPTAIDILSDFEEEDSDVTVVNPPESAAPAGALNRPVFEVIEIDSDSSRDSDVILREPPSPVVVDLVDSDTEEEKKPTIQVTLNNGTSTDTSTSSSHNEDTRKPLLPLKIRLKHKRQLKKINYHTTKQPKLELLTPSSTSTSLSSCSDTRSSSSSSDTDSDRRPPENKRKRKVSRSRSYYRRKRSSREQLRSSRRSSSDTEDGLPLSVLRRKKARKSGGEEDCEGAKKQSRSCTEIKGIYSDLEDGEQQNGVKEGEMGGKREENVDEFYAGPSGSNGRRRDRNGKKINSSLWYSRPFDDYWSDGSD